MFCRQCQYASFGHRTFDVIVFNDYMLLEHFYRKQFGCAFMLCQQYLLCQWLISAVCVHYLFSTTCHYFTYTSDSLVKSKLVNATAAIIPTSFSAMKHLVTLTTYLRYTNNCKYLSIYANRHAGDIAFTVRLFVSVFVCQQRFCNGDISGVGWRRAMKLGRMVDLGG